MDFFRQKVSGDKKRHQESNYNLDLSYITPRLIAMAFPATGIETVYRNDIKEVSQFIKEKHHNNFLVMNLSGRHYDYNKFDNQVEEFEWVDHHAPPLIILFKICHRIKQFLLQDKKNVVFVNCQAGKGRTGTIICCFLLFSGLFEQPEECFHYYSKKRFKRGEGVTQPSQRRYVEYFQQLLMSDYSYAYMINIVGIYIKKLPPKFQGKFKPYIQFHDKNKEMISYTNQKGFFEQKKIFTNEVDLISITESTFSKEAKGDLTIKIYNNEMIKSKKIGRISFNTALIDPKVNVLTFNLNEIDPDSLINDKDIPRDFQIVIKYKMTCACQKNNFSTEFLCEKCRVLLDNEISNWDEARKIITEYRKSNANSKELLFGDEDDDLKQTIYTTLDNFCGEDSNSKNNNKDKEIDANGDLSDWDKIEALDVEENQKDGLNTSGNCTII